MAKLKQIQNEKEMHMHHYYQNNATKEKFDFVTNAFIDPMIRDAIRHSHPGQKIIIRKQFDGKDHKNQSYRTSYYVQADALPTSPAVAIDQIPSSSKQVMPRPSAPDEPAFRLSTDQTQYFYEEKEESQRVESLHTFMNLSWKYVSYTACVVVVWAVWYHFH